LIEGARSSRSKCKTCRRKINKDVLRIGILIEGPYGTGYMWHHLNCAAKRRLDDVEEAYKLEAWNAAKEPPKRVPKIEDLRLLVDKAEAKKKERKEIPYAEIDPSGRAKCKHCDEPLEKGSLRVALGRNVEFGNQVRTTPINVHPRCVALEMEAEDCGTEPEGFVEALRANSKGLTDDQLNEVIAAVGELPG
jgi:hypothetical protein